MLYSLVVMIGDGKGSFWCGTEGKYMSSDPTSRARAGPGEEEEEEKSSATRFEPGGPKGALRFDETTTPSPGGRATAAARGTVECMPKKGPVRHHGFRGRLGSHSTQ